MHYDKKMNKISVMTYLRTNGTRSARGVSSHVGTASSFASVSRAIIRTLLPTLAFAVLFVGCMSSAIKQTDLYKSYFDTPIKSGAAEARYEKNGDIQVIHLSGDEYSMGFEYGKKAAELGVASVYDEIFANAVNMLKDDAPQEYKDYIDKKMLKRLLLDAWNIMAAHVPAYVLQMLRGFSEGGGLNLNDVYAMHAIPDFTETSCSALWATGTATETGSTLQIRVLDYIMGLGIQKYPVVVFWDFDQGHQVANIGWLGLLGVISGMNDTGLAVSEMGYGNPDGENFHAIPMPFLLLDVLRWCENPSEAAGIIKSNPRTNSYVYIVGSADNGALAFVTNPYEVEIFKPGQQDALVPQLTDCLHAGHYQERMDTLVAEHHGKITIKWLMEDFIPAIAMDSNLQCVIYDLDNRRFFLANAPDTERRAADQAYAEFSFP